MSLLRVLSLRDLLLQHLLLDHATAQTPLGGLHPELRQALREMGPDYEIPIDEDCFQSLRQGANLLALNIQPKDAVEFRPLLIVTGVFVARSGQLLPAFKAVSAKLNMVLSEQTESTVEQIWQTVKSLNRRDAVIGILHETKHLS